MKAALLVIATLFLISACATTDSGDSADSGPQFKYGGTYRVRGSISNNVTDGKSK